MAKGKNIRKKSEKILRRRRVKTNILKNRGWKLKYKEWKQVDYYPYIVKNEV